MLHNILRESTRRAVLYAIATASYSILSFYYIHSRPDASYWTAVLVVVLIELFIYNEFYGEEPLYITTQ